MKIKDINALEAEIINALRNKALAGDNEAASVLLNHLRQQSKVIDNWRSNKRKEEQNELSRSNKTAGP